MSALKIRCLVLSAASVLATSVHAYEVPDLNNQIKRNGTYTQARQIELCKKIEEYELELIKSVWPKISDDIQLDTHLHVRYFDSYHDVRRFIETVSIRQGTGVISPRPNADQPRFFLLAAFGLIVTTCLGFWLGRRSGRNRGVALGFLDKG